MPGRGGHTEFAAGRTLKVANRPQRVPFQPVARCRPSEWDKPLRALNPFNNIFFLSNNHLQALPRPEPVAARIICANLRRFSASPWRKVFLFRDYPEPESV